MDIRKYPYCLHSWADIVDDIDFNNLSILDKILLKSKEMRELGINDYQCERDVVALNKVFGLKEGVKNFDYGVQNMWLAGYDYGMSARIPRIHINYKKWGWTDSNNVFIGDRVLPKDYRGEKYRFATDAEIEGVYEFLCELVNKRKQQIEDAKNMPNIDYIKEKCYQCANDYLVSSFNKKVTCALKCGKTQVENSNYYAIVIYEDEQITENQLGHIKIDSNKYGEIYLTCKVPLCGEYTEQLKSLDSMDETIKSIVNSIVN